jgi:hypothetical protein
MQERAKFADKQNAWATSREEESIGTTLSNALRALPDLEKEGKDIKRLATDEINRVIGGFEQNALQLNIPAANKPKMIQRGVLRAVKEFVNDPTINKVDKFDIARDFLDSARTTGFGKFKVFSSISGREAITQGYGIIDSAEKAFTDKNKTLKHINEQKAGLAEGDPLDTAEFMIDNLDEIAVEIGADDDPRTFNVLSDLTHDLRDKIARERDEETARLSRNANIGEQFVLENSARDIIERLYDKAKVESTANDPLYTTYSIPDVYGMAKGTITTATPLVLKEIQPFVTQSLKNIDNELEPQIRQVLKDRSLSEQEKKDRINTLGAEIKEAEVKKLEDRVKTYVSQIIPPIPKEPTEEEKKQERINSLMEEKGFTEEQAKRTLDNVTIKEEKGKVFNLKEDGKLETDYLKLEDMRKPIASSVFDTDIDKYNEVFENSRNKNLLINKPEAVDDAFNNLRLLRQSSIQGLRSRASKLLKKDLDMLTKDTIQGDMNTFLKNSGGVTEGEAAEGFIRVRIRSPRISFLGSKSEIIPYDHSIQSLVRTNYENIPIIRLNTIKGFKNKDKSSIYKVNQIIKENAISIGNRLITPSEFIKAQEDVYQRATLPITIPSITD